MRFKPESIEVTLPKKLALTLLKYQEPLKTMIISSIVSGSVVVAGNLTKALLNIKEYDINRKVLEHDEYVFTEKVNNFTQLREQLHLDEHDLSEEQRILLKLFFDIEEEKDKKKSKKKGKKSDYDDTVIGNGGHIHG